MRLHAGKAPRSDRRLGEAAAKAMRHREETQGSDTYDKASHDRLAAAATQYLDTFARTFAPSA